MVIAAKSAKFFQPFTNIGLIPDCGGTYFLPRLIGDARARAIAFLAKPIDAALAEEWGMIWCSYDDAELEAQASALCDQLAALPTETIGLTKRAFAASSSNNLDAQLNLERE